MKKKKTDTKKSHATVPLKYGYADLSAKPKDTENVSYTAHQANGHLKLINNNYILTYFNDDTHYN